MSPDPTVSHFLLGGMHEVGTKLGEREGAECVHLELSVLGRAVVVSGVHMGWARQGEW